MTCALPPGDALHRLCPAARRGNDDDDDEDDDDDIDDHDDDNDNDSPRTPHPWGAWGGPRSHDEGES